MARFTVTGCCGFIGSNLVQALLDAGHLVTGLDDLSTGFKENIEAFLSHSSFSFIEGDIRDPELCSVACDGADYVLHQAALGSVPRSLEYPALYNSVNIGGTLNMLNAARDAKVKRFVFASSSSVYGDTAVLPKVETMIPNPKSPYAVTKITCEYFAKVYNDAYRLPTIGLRYFNVFGARQNPASQYAAVIPKFVTAFLKNESPTIFGDGAQTRDFTYIDNVVMANLKACDAPLSSCGVSYNIGCGGRISLNQLAQEIQHLTQSSAVPTYGPARAGDVRDSLADVRLAETCLGLQNLIQLRDGLAKTVDWYRTRIL